MDDLLVTFTFVLQQCALMYYLKRTFDLVSKKQCNKRKKKVKRVLIHGNLNNRGHEANLNNHRNLNHRRNRGNDRFMRYLDTILLALNGRWNP